jgi:hypothetical protein
VTCRAGLRRHYGGLQSLLSTWQASGGAAYAPYPHQASRHEQIAVAERLPEASDPWAACATEPGLGLL